MGNDAFGSFGLGGAKETSKVGDFSQCTRTECIDYSSPGHSI